MAQCCLFKCCNDCLRRTGCGWGEKDGAITWSANGRVAGQAFSANALVTHFCYSKFNICGCAARMVYRKLPEMNYFCYFLLLTAKLMQDAVLAFGLCSFWEVALKGLFSYCLKLKLHIRCFLLTWYLAFAVRIVCQITDNLGLFLKFHPM